MIHVSLTSELPWQRNDAIKFFTCLGIFRYSNFFRNLLRGLLPHFDASDMAKFEQFPSKHFE